MEYIELEVCPICGAFPEKSTVDLSKPGGHGYPGCCSYQYKCEKCKMVKGSAFDDVYHTKEAAQNKAKESWNAKCEEIQGYMKNKN